MQTLIFPDGSMRIVAASVVTACAGRGLGWPAQ